MGAVASAVSDVVGGVADAVGDVVKGVGDVVESVGNEVVKTVENAIENPIQTAAVIASIANPALAPVLIPAGTAAQTLDNGGSFDDAVKAAAISYAAQTVATNVAGNLNASSSLGTDIASQQTGQLAAQNAGLVAPDLVSSSIGNAAGAATGTLLSGGDAEDVLRSAAGAGGGTYVGGNVAASTKDTLGTTGSTIAGKTAGAATSAALTGKDPGASAVNTFVKNVISTSLSDSAKAGTPTPTKVSYNQLDDTNKAFVDTAVALGYSEDEALSAVSNNPITVATAEDGTQYAMANNGIRIDLTTGADTQRGAEGALDVQGGSDAGGDTSTYKSSDYTAITHSDGSVTLQYNNGAIEEFDPNGQLISSTFADNAAPSFMDVSGDFSGSQTGSGATSGATGTDSTSNVVGGTSDGSSSSDSGSSSGTTSKKSETGLSDAELQNAADFLATNPTADEIFAAADAAGYSSEQVAEMLANAGGTSVSDAKSAVDSYLSNTGQTLSGDTGGGSSGDTGGGTGSTGTVGGGSTGDTGGGGGGDADTTGTGDGDGTGGGGDGYSDSFGYEPPTIIKDPPVKPPPTPPIPPVPRVPRKVTLSQFGQVMPAFNWGAEDVTFADSLFTPVASPDDIEGYNALKNVKPIKVEKIGGLGLAGKFINQQPDDYYINKQQDDETVNTAGWQAYEPGVAPPQTASTDDTLYFNYDFNKPWWNLTSYPQVFAAEGGPIGHNPEFYSEGGASIGNRYVKGRGDGTSDSVPAMLATGEFVIPADVVSSLGNGDNDAGAGVLDKFMAEIRKHKREVAPNKLPPDSLGPLSYLQSAMAKSKGKRK